MGKNYLEQASYNYLHGVKEIPRKMVIKLIKKWNRHNFDLDEMRHYRKKEIEKIEDKNMNDELQKYNFNEQD